MKGHPVNFVYFVYGNMIAKRKVLANVKYEDEERAWREGLPYACHLTCIFQHFRVNLKGFEKDTVKSS